MFMRTGSVIEPFLVLAVLAGLAYLFFNKRRQIVSRQAHEPKDAVAEMAKVFVVKPYLQLGSSTNSGTPRALELLWHTISDCRNWQVQVRVGQESQWSEPVTAARIVATIAKLPLHQRFCVTLNNLPSGREFDYRILADGAVAFASRGKNVNDAQQAYKFVVAGDIGEAWRNEPQEVACRIASLNPDFVAIPGDVAYQDGLVRQYFENVFAVYNCEVANPASGAPLMRSRVVVPCLGNHDVAMPNADDRRDFDHHADLLGYFLFWSLPLNGPEKKLIGKHNTPWVEGDDDLKDAFLKEAGARYPRTANFSFDWGNAHWTVLDANPYMDWTNADLRAWVEADLAASASATWRFVMFHQPPFSSDGKHNREHRMRLLSPIFERYKVDVVFCGHNHCYERTYPLRFQPDKMETQRDTDDCPVPGKFQIDTKYDGALNCRPDGVIYVIDGAAGAKFYPTFQPTDGLKSYTCRYDQTVHSFTLVEVDGRKLTARQLSDTGSEIDHFVIEK